MATAPRAEAVPCAGGGPFGGGTGTGADPYLISTESHLREVAGASYLDCSFRQTADISLTGTWMPIGAAPGFTGEYDGANHLISGMTINDSSVGSPSWVGLFGYTGEGAVIKNLRLQGTVNVTNGVWVGGLVGIADYHTDIINVHASVDVSAGNGVGGLVGFLPESTISKSSSTGAVTGTGNGVGGLVGFARGEASYNPGTRPAAEIIDSYATGPVTAGVGYYGVAGLLGFGEYSTPGVNVTRSYSTGLVTGGAGQRQDCPYGSGGPCFTENGTSGGLIANSSFGSTDPRLFVANSFWDTQTSGQSSTADGKGTGATTSQMKSLATFSAASWNISDGWSATDTWGICDGQGYPFLNAQFTSSPCSPPIPPVRFALTTAKAGTGSGRVTSSPAGIDCGSSCSAEFDSGTSVTLSASAASGSEFSGWGGACSGSSTCTVTMDAAKSVTATFDDAQPVPSNRFTVGSAAATGSTVRTRIRVPGPGRITQRGTRSRRSGAAARVLVCRDSKSARRAGSYTLSCRANAATRRAQRSGKVRVLLRTTYTPTGGSANTRSRLVTLPSRKPRPPRFTG